MYYSFFTSHTFRNFHTSAVFINFPLRSSLHRGKKSIVSSVIFPVFILVAFFHLPCACASSTSVSQDYHRLAYEAQLNQEYSRALTYYFKAVAVNPDHGPYWNDIGFVYELMGDLDNAEKSYLRSIRIDRNFMAPYANLGMLYRKKQNHVKAIYYLQKRIELGDPSDPWTQKAREELEDVYRATPFYREQFLNAETDRLNLQVSQKTRENFRNQMKVANSEYERGMELLKQQKSQDAIKAFNDSLAFAPGNPKVIDARLQAMKLSRIQRVEQIVQKAMEFLKEGKEQAAKKKFTEALAIIPNQTD